MKVLQGARFMLRSRGLARGFRRLGYILKRFGWTPAKQMRRIQRYLDVLARHGVPGTFFVPASVLLRHAEAFRALRAPALEWGVHADTHTDLSRLDRASQLGQFVRAAAGFDRAGVRFTGFRAPYLKTNAQTLSALTEAGRFLYDSSRPLLWHEGDIRADRALQWIRGFYGPALHGAAAALPAFTDGVVSLPVSLPDDDILVDREGLAAPEILALWSRILTACHTSGEMFVLQLHPERSVELAEVLEELIRRAKALSPPVWIASLGQVARRWRERPERRWPEPYQAAFCVSGDIDAVTLGDFWERLRRW
jgi:peptidoglycan/xylan/chitin deacetylase (PgdA/CDA1 family)